MSYDPSIGRWTQEDPIAFAGGDVNLYRYVGNGPTNHIDPSGTIAEDWRLDMSDHGGPHIQKGNLRWDAMTLKPIPHKGITPPKLTRKDLDEIRKSGLFDKIVKNIENSVVKEAVEETLKEAQKRGLKDLSKGAARELAENILKKGALPLTIFFASCDYAEGGAQKVAKNLVIPGDLIESITQSVAEQARDQFDDWLNRENYLIWVKKFKKHGFDQSEADRMAREQTGYGGS